MELTPDKKDVKEFVDKLSTRIIKDDIAKNKQELLNLFTVGLYETPASKFLGASFMSQIMTQLFKKPSKEGMDEILVELFAYSASMFLLGYLSKEAEVKENGTNTTTGNINS